MNITIPYEEVIGFIKREYKIGPKITVRNNKSLDISYSPSMFIPSAHIGINLLDACNDVISFSYDCGKAASVMIAGIAAYLNDKIPEGIEVNLTKKHINVYPTYWNDVKNILKYMRIKNVSFDNVGVNVVLEIKQ